MTIFIENHTFTTELTFQNHNSLQLTNSKFQFKHINICNAYQIKYILWTHFPYRRDLMRYQCNITKKQSGFSNPFSIDNCETPSIFYTTCSINKLFFIYSVFDELKSRSFIQTKTNDFPVFILSLMRLF